MKSYKINGYDIISTYAGIDQFTVYKDGKEIGTCWSVDAVGRLTETSGSTVMEEFYKQR